LVYANIRNVLFCGATRSGKTTSFKILQDPCYCPETSSIFSETRDTNFKAFSLKNNKTGNVHSFILSLIDSPGTFEIQSDDSLFKKRSNEKIGELIVECLRHEVTYLNLVVLFLPISSRVDDRDIQSVDLFVSMFKNYVDDKIKITKYISNIEINNEIKLLESQSDIEIKEQSKESLIKIEEIKIKVKELEKHKKLPMILCLTHADKYNDKKREQTINEIKKHPDLKKYFENNDIELLFMGCVDHAFGNYYNADEMSDDYKLVSNWRKDFLDRIFKAQDRIDLKNTCIYFTRQKDVGELLQICVNELDYLSKSDKDTSDYKFRLVGHKLNMDLLFKHKMLLDEDEIYKKLTGELWDIIQTIRKSNLIENQKLDLLSPWSIKH